MFAKELPLPSFVSKFNGEINKLHQRLHTM